MTTRLVVYKHVNNDSDNDNDKDKRQWSDDVYDKKMQQQ